MTTPRGQQLWQANKLVALGLAALLFLTAGFGSWVVLAELSGAIIAEGRLSEKRANLLIQHIDGGVAKDILINEGDNVSANTTLIRLEDGPTLSELRIVETRLFEVIARRNRIEAERDSSATITFDPDLVSSSVAKSGVYKIIEGQVRLFNARKISRKQEIAALLKKALQIRNQIDGIDAQINALRTQLTLINVQLADMQALLDQGLTPANTVSNLQQKTAIIRGKIGAFVAERAEAHVRIAGIDIEILRGNSQRHEDAINQLRDLEFRQAELTENHRALRVRLEKLSIRSPIDGVVLGLGSISPRTVIKPAEVLMQIAPQERRYVFVTRITPAEVDQIYPDQPVRIVFATLETDDNIEFVGQISQISADTLSDTSTDRPYYRVEVNPSAETQAQLSERDGIFPGMPVQLYIRTTDQPAWRYLAKPFAHYFTRAFRES